jgi:hypothetical protein
MNEKLIHAIVFMTGSESAIKAAMDAQISAIERQMRTAVVAGKSVDAARYEGMITALEQVYQHLSKFAARYRVEQDQR